MNLDWKAIRPLHGDKARGSRNCVFNWHGLKVQSALNSFQRVLLTLE